MSGRTSWRITETLLRCGGTPISQQMEVDFVARRSLHQHWPDDELHVDEDAGCRLIPPLYGADGDTWSASNVGSFIGRRMPLTEQRAQLIADLRAEYLLSS